MRRGLTLIEVTVSVSILLLLAALIFPIVARARTAGYRAETITHLRQVGMGIEMYRNDYDGAVPFGHLDPFVEAGYIKDLHLLRSRPDEFTSGYGHTVSQCVDTFGPTLVETSYETSLLTKEFYDRLQALDPNAAIVVDRTHGEVLAWADKTCERAVYYYQGRILRLYPDSSVKVGLFSLIDWKASPDIGLAWHRLKLFTDKEEQLGRQ
jgi:prepilin-type N-terminal cleavage/methylation domain-containing protein